MKAVCERRGVAPILVLNVETLNFREGRKEGLWLQYPYVPSMHSQCMPSLDLTPVFVQLQIRFLSSLMLFNAHQKKPVSLFKNSKGGHCQGPSFCGTRCHATFGSTKDAVSPLGLCGFVLRRLRDIFNILVNRLRKYVQGRKKINHLEVVDRKVVLYCMYLSAVADDMHVGIRL